MSEEIYLEKKTGYAIMTINRPKQMNALNTGIDTSDADAEPTAEQLAAMEAADAAAAAEAPEADDKGEE